MSIINPFAVLGDAEEDDISTLIAHGVSKAGAAATIVRRPPPPLVKKAEVPVKQTDYGRGERGQGRGGRGRNDLDGNGSIQSQSRGRESGRNVLDGNGSIQFQNKHTDPYQRSYGGSNGYQRNSGGSNRYQNDNEGAVSNQKNNRGANGYQRNRGNGYQRNYGRNSNGNAVDERNQGSSGRGRVLTEYHESRDSNQIKTRSEQIKSEGQNGDGQVKSEWQNGDGQVKSEGQTVDGQVKSEGQNGDGQIKSEEQNGDGEGWKQVHKYHGKGYGRGSQTFKDFGNGNHSSGSDRRGYGGGSNGFRNGEARFNGTRQEARFNGTRQGPNHEKHEILNNNYEKEGDSSKEGEGDKIEAKEGNHGNKEHEINDDDNTGGLEGNMTVTDKGSNIAEPGQGKLAQERRKDADERKRAAAERQNQMTLEEYEQKLLEKRKKLPPLKKTEGKRVVLEKEFESMQRIEKKKDDSHSNKLKAENDKLKRNGSLDKEEKVHKATINIDEFRQPPRRRWREERAKSEEEIPAEPVEVAAPSPAPPAPCIEDQLLFPVLGGPPKV